MQNIFWRRAGGFLCVFMSVVLGGEAFEKNNERAFYAISSLCCHLEEGEDFTFTETDIDGLWNSAVGSSYYSEVDVAHEYYQKAEFKDAKQVLEGVWAKLNVDLLENDFSLKDEKIKEEITPYLLPEESPLRAPLDLIFRDASVLDNPDTFRHAGFITLFSQPKSYIIVAKHPWLRGYLTKCYLNSEERTRLDQPGWKWLVKRCEGASYVRRLIKEKNLKHFVVPDKWLYPLPVTHANATQKVVLVVTDMKLVSHSDSEYAWKHLITHEHLEELYCILSHGYSSSFLPGNIPYTKKGKFACIDTEYPKRKHSYAAVRQFISKEMRPYWDQLVKKGGK